MKKLIFIPIIALSILTGCQSNNYIKQTHYIDAPVKEGLIELNEYTKNGWVVRYTDNPYYYDINIINKSTLLTTDTIKEQRVRCELYRYTIIKENK